MAACTLHCCSSTCFQFQLPYRFSFDRKQCAVQTNQRFKIKATMASNTDLYQFQARPAVTSTALVASGAKPFADSMILRL
ncbi:hypothetical protein PI125_g25347 [Phytophthora idaei]|nr:hypothetical protein PI125_g25347 [Phytophthora idaei]